jgi:uncharacterized membrane protein
MGWKVAWSDRMVSMYTSILFFAWVWYPFRRKLKALPVWGFLLMLLPMALDGSTPSTFYIGDALGSFNSWMRLITGILFGLGLVWFGFPYLEDAFTSMTGKKDNKHLNPELVKPPPQREHVL